MQGTNHSLHVNSINNSYTIISINKPSAVDLQHYTDNVQVSGNLNNFKGQTYTSISYQLLLTIFAMEAMWGEKKHKWKGELQVWHKQ